MLERQGQELRRINEQLEQFAYIASHDLQEPLRKVRFFTDILQGETKGRVTGEAEDAMSRITTAVLRMDHLVRDLLVLARAGKSLAVRQSVSLNDVVADAIEALEKSIAESGCRIEVGSLPTIRGDRSLLTQVFLNLLGNAIHYRKRDHPPAIRISGGIEQESVVVRVADQGIGFPNDKADRIFEPFVRLSTVQVDGTGIGLAICKRIIEAHDGVISASSTVDHGAVFTLTFPLYTTITEAS
jgi:light-regulated signal transduction histidine kinase (bacteriophytochrome)